MMWITRRRRRTGRTGVARPGHSRRALGQRERGNQVPVLIGEVAGILELRMIGVYETAEIRAALLSARAPGVPRRGPLFDVTRSEVLGQRSHDDLRAMALFLAGESEHFGRRLALVATEQLQFGLMRLGGAYTDMEGVTTAVFVDEDSARAWLEQAPVG
jgi:hypothetical protein